MSSLQTSPPLLESPMSTGDVDATPVDAPKATPVPRAEFAPRPTYEGFRVYQFTVEQYHRMAESGIIPCPAPIVLIDGILVHKMTLNAPHNIAMDTLMPWLVRAIPDGWHLSNQMPLILSDHSDPEPDFKVVRGKPTDYRHQRVSAKDTAIVIEVSDSSLVQDQTIMKARYAAAMIPEYWIVNLVSRRVEVYTDPTGPEPSPTYRHRDDFGPESEVPFRLEGREIARLLVSDILPPD